MQTSEGLTDLLLSFYDVRELGVGDPRVQLTFHQRRPLVIFDVSQVAAFRHFDVFGKPLTGVGGGGGGYREKSQRRTGVTAAVPAS